MDVPCVEGMSLLRCPCVPPLGVRRVSAAAHMGASAGQLLDLYYNAKDAAADTHAVSENVIARSEATWQSVSLV